MLTLRDADGNEQTLRVTEEHPFYVDAAGWTPARKLDAGDIILGADGPLTVVSNEAEQHPGGVTVYNLEVEQAHTYFVRAEDANDAAAEVLGVRSGDRESWSYLAASFMTRFLETPQPRSSPTPARHE